MKIETLTRTVSVMLLCAFLTACGGGGGGGGDNPPPPPPAQDTDGDGVNDSQDQCANTPAGEAVDANGCSESQKDDDGDGVSNADDQCANTPAGESVNGDGCSASQLDDDGDGVSNADDQCANTPAGEAVDANGCSESQKDDDGDGVSNADDSCPNTPAGTAVGSDGCPLPPADSDGDGVPDGDDQCANTPAGEAVDANGCSESQKDDDGDGVSNADDQCANTPAGTAVGSDGCPVNQKPVITLQGADPLNLDVGDAYTDPGATANDPEDGDITSNIIVGGDVVDTGTAGTYVVTYNVSDSQGLAADEVTRTVIVNAPQPPDFVWIGKSERAVPNAATFTTPITFEVCVTGSLFDRLVVTYYEAYMTGTSTAFREVDLVDTGESCDATIPDARLYAVTEVPAVEMPSDTPLKGDVASYMQFSFAFLDENGDFIPPSGPLVPFLELAVYDPAIPACVPEQLADNVFACPGIVNIVLEPSDFEVGLGEFMQKVAMIYLSENEEVDFLQVVTENRTIGRNNPFFGTVRNDVNGLCRSVFDSSDQYGSDGTLQGIMNTRLFAQAANHEVGHRWGYDCAEPAGTRYEPFPIHYDVVSFTDPMSQGRGYLALQQNNNYLWDVPEGGFLNKRFSSLTQYMAGAITAAEVEPWRVISESAKDRYQLNDEVLASDTTEYLVSDYHAANGVVESADGSPRQTDFTIGRILVSVGRPASANLMTFASYQTEYIVSNQTGVNVFETGFIPLRDPRSINDAFEQRLQFTDGVRRRTQSVTSASKLAASLQSIDSPSVTARVPSLVIHEPRPKHFDYSEPELVIKHQKHPEFESGHEFEVIELKDVTGDFDRKN